MDLQISSKESYSWGSTCTVVFPGVYLLFLFTQFGLADNLSPRICSMAGVGQRLCCWQSCRWSDLQCQEEVVQIHVYKQSKISVFKATWHVSLKTLLHLSLPKNTQTHDCEVSSEGGNS
ncbi:hypothetical protein KIL84_002405 [Mauremys mutica]|uniref:Uncharacterized protein n=1 Tax=Mauremys mutica TaxID=74926 RepID=A0A9D3X6Q9_9SAUR|nr:hypothetical protein KIL84_002405 [Mauremys mutica]